MTAGRVDGTAAVSSGGLPPWAGPSCDRAVPPLGTPPAVKAAGRATPVSTRGHRDEGNMELTSEYDPALKRK